MACFRRWVGGLITNLSGTIAVVDCKTVRGSGSGDETAIHMVSAFETRLVLGQEKVAKKCNEITAIPELFDALYMKDLFVSIDAMSCQHAIADRIVVKGADYLLGVKGNQPALHQAIHDAFIDHKDTVIHVHSLAAPLQFAPSGLKILRNYRVLHEALKTYRCYGCGGVSLEVVTAK